MNEEDRELLEDFDPSLIKYGLVAVDHTGANVLQFVGLEEMPTDEDFAEFRSDIDNEFIQDMNVDEYFIIPASDDVIRLMTRIVADSLEVRSTDKPITRH